MKDMVAKKIGNEQETKSQERDIDEAIKKPKIIQNNSKYIRKNSLKNYE